MATTRIGLLHLEPVLGEIGRNRELIERGLVVAAGAGVQWVVTPELCVSGYDFTKHVGTDWIRPQPDSWMSSILELVKAHNLTVFLSHPERVSCLTDTRPLPSDHPSEESTADDRAHPDVLCNSLFVIGPRGDMLGVYRKIRTTGGAERWSTSGQDTVVVDCSGTKVGLLICADVWFPEICQSLKGKGAQLLISASAWPPGHCGPGDSWERRTADTGLPLWVCNRTGQEEGITLDYRQAESVVAQEGRRLLAKTAGCSSLLYFDWDMDSMSLLSKFVAIQI